jgi:hypothetical protein
MRLTKPEWSVSPAISLSREDVRAAYEKAKKMRVKRRFHITDTKSAKQAALKLTVRTGYQWEIREQMWLMFG